jgi:SAM-dependent methyltransferase
MKSNREIVADFYGQRCTPDAKSFEAHGWISPYNQKQNYDVAAAVIDLDKPLTLLDVGCGQGDFFGYLRARKSTLLYTGIDLTPAMIETARWRFPDGLFLHEDFLGTFSGDDGFDFVLALGAFSVEVEMPELYLELAISKVFRLTRRTAVITIPSNRGGARPDQANWLHLYSPTKVLDFCLALTPHVTLKHGLQGAQMTIVLARSLDWIVGLPYVGL